MYRFFRLLLICLLSYGPELHALSVGQVPEPLKPWVGWVLAGSPDLGCPFFYSNYNDKRCAWPVQTQLALTSTGGNFTVTWQLFQASWIQLPGDASHWPQQVEADGKPLIVTEQNGLPVTRLAPGSYRIGGTFAWTALPDNLTLPATAALLDLTINGQMKTPILRDGQLWLKSAEGTESTDVSANRLEVQVFRKIIDDIPQQALTRLIVDISGKPREATFDFAQLPGFQALDLQSELPARLQPDGHLKMQMRPGHWQIDILSRSEQPLSSLSFGKAANEAGITRPLSEIWVFESRPQLRTVTVEQLEAIDPSQSNLPDEWKTLPAYRIGEGQAMVFNVIGRGEENTEPNQLNLTRTLWLDFNGEGYTVNDKISGTLKKGWRLNAESDFKLGRVALNGVPQLITELKDSGKQGVEVRKGMLAIDADSRIERAITHLSATGWEQDFQTVSAELNLPPGWHLLAAAGMDNVPDSWLARWTLLDLFMVLIAALAIAKLWRVSYGVLALVTLGLCWQEAGAPHFLWLNVLVAVALTRVLPAGRFSRVLAVYRLLSWLALVLITIPFLVMQLRLAIYPQLENPWAVVGEPATSDQTTGMPMPAAAKLEERAEVRSMMKAKESDYLQDKLSSSYANADFSRIDPNAKVQTGPGLPQWRWQTVQLSWNSSVAPSQTVRLWYLSPATSMLLSVVRVVLVFGLILLLADAVKKFKTLSVPPSWLGLLLLMPLAAVVAPKAQADFPSQDMLESLKNKLLEPPDCLPACAQIPHMRVSVNQQTATLSLQIHAHKAVAVPLPADAEQWFPHTVTVDGLPASGLLRSDNSLWLSLEAGTRDVVMTGKVPLLSKFIIPLPLKPHALTIEADGWDVKGWQEGGVVEDVLQFVLSAGSDQAGKFTAEAVPPFVRIERTLQLGLDWRIHTQVSRMTPADTALRLSVPLVPGESVTTEGISSDKGTVTIFMSPQQMQMQWDSTLVKSEQILLQAAPASSWTEVWQADVSPIWHVETNGFPMIYIADSGQRLPEWRPWPGEKLTLTITRPAPVAGSTLTIDNTSLRINAGQRSRDAELTMNLRSSQAVQHPIKLPDDVVLQSVAVDGQAQPIRLKGAGLTLPVRPGRQQWMLRWQLPEGVGSVLTTPLIDLGSSSVNASLNVEMGQDRWVLFTAGPRLGPAVLFWGMLGVCALIAFVLGRVRLTPLKGRHWFLLFLGLVQLPPESAAVIVIWLLSLGWRATLTSRPRYFNLMQSAIVLLTFFALAQLAFAVAQGLLSYPSMAVTGNGSTAHSLRWYQDRTSTILPTATVISVPMTIYRILMLLWSLWLASALLKWLKWGWSSFNTGGIWHKKSPSSLEIKSENEVKN